MEHMALEEHETAGELEDAAAPVRRRRWLRVAIALLAMLVVAFLGLWLARKDIADNVVKSQLQALGLPGTYTIDKISPGEQVVRNLVIGNPARPDLTVEEVRVRTRLAWGIPGIGRITLVRPRLYGAIRDGKPSFGSLDKVLFTGGKAPFRMPDYDIAIDDGRALIETDSGPVGVKVDGKGPLRGGFAGELAAVAPHLDLAGCRIEKASLYGKVTTSAEKPRFKGPVRIGQLDCASPVLRLSQAGLQLDATADPQLDGVEATAGLKTAGLDYAANHLSSAQGTLRASYRKEALTARYDVTAKGVATGQARMASLELSGQGRTSQGFSRLDFDTDVTGKGVTLGAAPDRMLADAAKAGEGTLVAPLMKQIRAALAREARGSALAMNVIVRRSEAGTSVIVPRGTLRGGSGASLLALSRVQALFGNGSPRISGNFVTGGAGLPQLYGRMEAQGSDGVKLLVNMPEYRAGDTRVGLQQLSLIQDADGGWNLGGRAQITGALPGGRAEGLVLPIEGRIAPSGTLSLWRQCIDASFDRLAIAQLSLDRRSLTLCPPRGGAIVSGGGGAALRIAAGTPGLSLSGKLGATPIRIDSGAIGFAYPGALTAHVLEVSLGPPDTASRFRIANLDAMLGKEIAGNFGGSDVSLYAVPLDLHETAGHWRYAGGVLTLGDVSFRLEDRQQVDRFQPLVARGADLTLKDNHILAHATLREPNSDREVVRTTIEHDLATASGHADLAVDGIVFDDKLQADELSHLALGVVSNLNGTVRGSGQIDWNANGVTSGGRFSSDKLDFAAAFGPVSGLSGTVVFTDLLGLVTAPDQTLKIASINPGIEVNDGALTFQLEPGYLLRVKGAHWPFMDGTLELEPTTMRVGVAETRHYTLRVTGLNAATFVQHLQLANVNATGIFDGEVPLVFDENGGRIENGSLTSRPPGGNLSYIGELTYKDLSAMGNFAFDALKSVDYKTMQIDLNGNLGGDIVTRIRFDGLSQGTGAKRNFLTKRIAKLPIRFILNIKAPFFSLFGSFKQLYDPSLVTDPRELGLVDGQGHAITKPTLTPPTLPPPPQSPPPQSPPSQTPPSQPPATLPAPAAPIQPSDSEKRP